MKCLMLLSGCCSVCGFRPEKKDGDRLSASVYLRPLKLGDRKAVSNASNNADPVRWNPMVSWRSR